jgi:Cytosine/uracil/thiamine/allantoin permeases
VSDPVSLIGHIQSPGWVALAMALIIIATLSTNTAANIVSPTNDFQNIAPKLINRTTAVILTGLVGLALMAHELLKKLGLLVSDVSLETVYSNWLLGYSSLLGPIAGIMVVDYFIIRQQKLDLEGLYLDGVYPAWNWNGFIAFGVPVVLTLLSLGSSAFSWFYDYGWFTGSLLGAAIYYGLSRLSNPQTAVVKGAI